MGDSHAATGPPPLLHYRPWRGAFRPPSASIWPIARVALGLILRRRLFWFVYSVGLLVFAMFFFGQYLLAWAEGQVGESEVFVSGAKLNPRFFIDTFRTALKINGTGETYRVYFQYQVYILTVLLALTGSIIIGNDLRFGTLPYYLSKPLGRRHYLLGKGLAVAVCINLLTTIPALLLYLQWGLLSSYEHFYDRFDLLVGIVGYGMVLTVTLTLLLLATAIRLRQTIPLIMAWATIFYFLRGITSHLVDRLHMSPQWRLCDLWNSASIVGDVLLGLDPARVEMPGQPSWQEAACMLLGVSLLCLTYLILRIRAVEIVR
jgi:ABC-type transport system involved in multi-copper enzyme maturation permease subunit